MSELPAPAAQSSRMREYSRTLECREFVQLVAGGPMDAIPPEIIHEELLESIRVHFIIFGLERGAAEFRKKLPRELRVQLRAVRINVSRLKRENGGRLPWVQ